MDCPTRNEAERGSGTSRKSQYHASVLRGPERTASLALERDIVGGERGRVKEQHQPQLLQVCISAEAKVPCLGYPSWTWSGNGIGTLADRRPAAPDSRSKI